MHCTNSLTAILKVLKKQHMTAELPRTDAPEQDILIAMSLVEAEQLSREFWERIDRARKEEERATEVAI